MKPNNAFQPTPPLRGSPSLRSARLNATLAAMDRLVLVLLGVAFAGAFTVHAFTSLGLGLSFLIFFVGWPVLGTLVTIDDDLKGGWSNPDGSVRPPWLQAPFWGQVIGGLALASVGAAVDAGWKTQDSVPFWVMGAAGFAVAVPMIKTGFKKEPHGG